MCINLVAIKYLQDVVHNHHHNLVPEFFINPKGNSVPIKHEFLNYYYLISLRRECSCHRSLLSGAMAEELASLPANSRHQRGDKDTDWSCFHLLGLL